MKNISLFKARNYSYWEGRTRIARQILSVITTHIGRKSLKRFHALDIGCSVGIITNHLASYIGNITGIDIDRKAIRTAQKRYKKQNLQFLVMDGTKIRLANNQFDLVVCHQVYPCVSNKKALVSEIYKCLRPGGICLLATANNFSLSYWALQQHCHQFNVHHYTPLILSNPAKFNFNKLIPYQKVLRIFPLWFWRLVEPFIPNIIWLLEKPHNSKYYT